MIDNDRITDAIIATGASPLALEEGARLCQHWIDNGVCADKKISAVECGFVLWLDEATAVIGVQDLLTDEDGVIGNEWKTTRERGRYWGPEKWLAEIREGSQVKIYAMALESAIYYPRAPEGCMCLEVAWYDTPCPVHGENKSYQAIQPFAARPRIRVQAVSKSTPPELWGGDIIEFPEEVLVQTGRAITAKAASIRAMRKTAPDGPWQLPGIWCENKFRRVCEYHGDCLAGKYPVGFGEFSKSDPAFDLALKHIPLEKRLDPDLVILGASAYSAVSECAEKWRRQTISSEGNEESMALAVGSVFHTAVSEYYRQIQESQLI